jgi:hypothetical protein
MDDKYLIWIVGAMLQVRHKNNRQWAAGASDGAVQVAPLMSIAEPFYIFRVGVHVAY